MSFFKSNAQRAVAYAAMKELERLVGKDGLDGELPGGFSMDVSGQQVTITIPKGTVISKPAGPNGNGKINKQATQSLYGYAVWAAFLMRLRKFHQGSVVIRLLVEAMREVCAKPGKKTAEEELYKLCPELQAETERLRQEFPIPDREEDCPRRVDRENAKRLATIDLPRLKEAA